MKTLGIFLLAAVFNLSVAFAQTASSPAASSTQSATNGVEPAGPAKPRTIEEFLASLHFQKGDITIGKGLATLKVPEAFRFLDSKEAQAVLVDLWGNPPAEAPLGMLVPTGLSLADPNSWAVVISYDESGYVKDDDAAKIKYDQLLKDMQKDTAEGSKERVKNGYEAIDLVGWAAPPRYDADAKKLYWAKELKFGNSSDHTLNYDIRVLGRRGVLSLNCVAGMPQLKEIEARSPEILAMVNFNDGHRYADFDPKTDKIATYGLAALVAGGVAAKAGLFKVILGALVAGKKFVILGVVALVAFFRKVITGRKA